MMRQYVETKRGLPAYLLLMRVGDFYEAFFEDAPALAAAAGIVLTAKEGGVRLRRKVPMAGVPASSLEDKARAVVAAGIPVAVADQVEPSSVAAAGGGLVRRAVTRLITPGTRTADDAGGDGPGGAGGLNNYLAALAVGEAGGVVDEELLGELARLDPAELLVADRPAAAANGTPTGGVGGATAPATADAVDALLATSRRVPLNPPRLLPREAYLHLGARVIRDIEVLATARDGGRAGSLAAAVDGTATPGGRRLLRSWLLAPLRDTAAIGGRGAAVGALVAAREAAAGLAAALAGLPDLARLGGRVGGRRATPRELQALARGCARLPAVRAAVGAVVTAAAAAGVTDAGILPELAASLGDDRLDGAAEAVLGALIKNAGFALRVPRAAGERLLAEDASHFSRHGWSLRGSTRAELRYVSPELAAIERDAAAAAAAVAGLEVRLYRELRDSVGDLTPAVRAAAAAVAALDVLAGWASLAARRGYCRPVFLDGSADDGGGVPPTVELRALRHPVVERCLPPGVEYVPNDVALGGATGRHLAMLTAANGAGKSVYLYALAAAVVLAQAGCWVPASSARLTVTSALYTRVGAVDDVSGGLSTFGVEMAETATICASAGGGALVLADEVGRGTAVADGLAVAYAVAEYLAGGGAGGGTPPLTVFATHFHELNALAELRPNVAALRIETLAEEVWEGGEGDADADTPDGAAAATADGDAPVWFCVLF
ncbi:hypothetical protein I4F81_009899 [Pyropia yezoensis]|uniref:Uncharacterized protein n=1 Tax=Pyropia yezoensis TaxID=2788 RepID=A0ACC3CB44_PYRYE|nr:hypothetical protein I4F81_009899 [Neopyropia yezoensis]